MASSGALYARLTLQKRYATQFLPMSRVYCGPASLTLLMTQNLHQQFRQLSELLHSTEIYWRPAAFYASELPWMKQHLALVRELSALSPDDIARLGMDETLLVDFMAQHLPFAHDLRLLAAVDPLPQLKVTPVAARFFSGIPGRKWQQVKAFAQRVPPSEHLLEWCAGKSHLGFYLHQCRGAAVTALEWDGALVTHANARAAKQGVPLRSLLVDVLADQAEAHVRQAEQVVALHACGELHERLLNLCVQHQVPQLHLAPCCYHKRHGEYYRPLSAEGRALDLNLNSQELHTPVMETMTAGATERRQRQQLQIMRLGFDELQRDVRAVDEYLPLPSLPAQWARADFADFCLYCAAQKGVSMPAVVDWLEYQQRGERRFWRVSALDLVRFLFRRPLELWLVLDRALLLQENGYRVNLGSFCSSRVTPRNLLLQAWRL